MPLFYCIGIYKVQTCIWKLIGIFFVISQPLIEKIKPYSMPLLLHKCFFFLKFTKKIWILGFVNFLVYPPLVVDLDDLQLFLHLEVLFMLKLTNMTIIYFWLFLQSIHFQLTCHDILQLFPHILWNYKNLLVFYFIWKWFTFSCKTYILSLFPRQKNFGLKIWKSIVFASNWASTLHFRRVVFLFFVSNLISLGMDE